MRRFVLVFALAGIFSSYSRAAEELSPDSHVHERIKPPEHALELALKYGEYMGRIIIYGDHGYDDNVCFEYAKALDLILHNFDDLLQVYPKEVWLDSGKKAKSHLDEFCQDVVSR